MMPSPKLGAEFIGTAFLVVGVVGSGIMAERLTGDVGIQLLANAAATAGILLALILSLGPVSGAHFNPVVTMVARARGSIETPEALAYVVAQIVGGIVGTIVANVMFGLDPISIAHADRSGFALVFSESIATIGLLLVIFGVVAAKQPTLAAFTVSGYIGGAYFFTSSTSFANPAVTIARMFSDTFAGIDPANVPGFIGAQLIGGVIAIALIRWLFSGE